MISFEMVSQVIRISTLWMVDQVIIEQVREMLVM
jgi:hypothetical protein